MKTGGQLDKVAANLRGYGTTVIDGKNFKPVIHIGRRRPLYQQGFSIRRGVGGL